MAENGRYDALKAVAYLALLIATFVGGHFHGRKSAERGFVSDTTTVTIIDTMLVRKPVPVDSAVVRYISVRVPVYDEEGGEYDYEDEQETAAVDTSIADSVDVVLPITQKVYRDSTYTAWVSGYRPNLDSIETYIPTTYVTIREREVRSDWGIGISAGAVVSPKGVQPGISVGVTWTPFRFKGIKRRKH